MAAVVLAAGHGTRFGEAPKLLADLRGKPLVRIVVETALASAARPVHVVVGHRAAAILSALAGLPVRPVRNPLHADGLSTSLRAGFAALPPGTEAAIVLLGDMPAVTPGLVDDLAAAWRAHGRPDAVVPTYGGRRGNPVLLSVRLAPAIAALTGDTGAGPLLRGRERVLELAVPDAGVTIDIDTPDALASVQANTTPSRIAE